LAVGVNTTLPLPLISTLPPTADCTLLIVSTLPVSTSVSLPSRVAGVSVRAVSSLVLAELGLAIGASLVPRMLTLTVLVVPSAEATVKVSL
jgi:hypothetical protein